MEIRNLSGISHETLVQALLKAFSDYFVPFSPDREYWRYRFTNARVDYSLSFGTFDQGQLVAFFLTGVDEHEGVLTAYNAGTGVVPEYRGQQWVDKLYVAAFPHFRERGIKKCMLEVITDNHRAIRVYERIGMHISRTMRCFKGSLTDQGDQLRVQQVPYREIHNSSRARSLFYAWEQMDTAILQHEDEYRTWIVKGADNTELGYFVLRPANNYLPQLDTWTGDWEPVLDGIARTSSTVRFTNIDVRNDDLIDALLARGLVNDIDQHEMEMPMPEV